MANFGKVALPVSFGPQTAFPLDSRYYFDSLSAAESAAASAVEVGSSSGTYFIGENIVVVTATEATMYVIQPDHTLKPVGSGSELSGDNKSIVTSDGVISLKNFGVKYWRYDEASEAKYIETDWNDATNPAPSGLEAKVRLVSAGNYELAFYQPNPTTVEGLSSDIADLRSTTSQLSTSVENLQNEQLAFDNSAGSISLGGRSATLDNVAHSPTYDATNLKLTIPVYGGSDVVVNIPKDKFVTAGKYYDVYPEGATGETAQHQVIVLTIENQTEPVIIPASSLVNILTAESTNTITMQISDDDKISASVKIDPSSDNAITSSASGIKVDLSGKMDAITGATGGKIAVTDANGNVDESAFAIQSTGELSSMTANDIPVATVIAAAINAVQTTISQGKLDKLTGSTTDAGKLVVVGADGASITFGALTIQDIQTALANKVDKITGTENDIVTLGANGAIQDSGKVAGGATLAATPDANTLATEAAVNAAMSWIEI